MSGSGSDTDRATSANGIDPALDFFAGTVAGIAALAVGFPFDTVKVRLQNPDIAAKYRSTFHTLFTIVREEGVRGLYRGIAAPLLSSAPLNGLIFTSYKYLMNSQLHREGDIPTLTQITLAGAGSGVIASTITTPIELIKIHQQSSCSPINSVVSRQLASTRDVAGHILKTYGLCGFYRGITSTVLRDTGYGAYFLAYEGTLRLFSPAPPHPDSASLIEEVEAERASHSWPALLLAGGIAGVAGWVATFPFDVVKTRVQSIHGALPGHPYRSTWSTIVASYRAEGLGVFFRGLAPTLIRAIPVNMVTFATFEAIVHAFS
ncbi:carnitine/acyl carnitine carrier [Obba rivulosa]|uniref:Carnitine/acyl carnitine carrier n=1 Tax=Obba rivulosa TaxID=1052685 RepID=A0A8E2ATR4_9APHY|nr:carnitine/acyl carnitine carrier [Obba rivulosa]